jgi:hypothetical protein
MSTETLVSYVAFQCNKRQLTKAISACFQSRECFMPPCANGWTCAYDHECYLMETEEAMLSFAKPICKHQQCNAFAVLSRDGVYVSYWLLDKNGDVLESFHLKENDREAFGNLQPSHFVQLSQWVNKKPEDVCSRMFPTQVELNAVRVASMISNENLSVSYSVIEEDVRDLGLKANEKYGLKYLVVGNPKYREDFPL